ncbi:MAG: hypothetical protein WBF90_23095 [Rivularia sp. (in: cyanobacteria)]
MAVSTHIYSEKNEAECDWNGVKYKYDPAWDDGSAFPSEWCLTITIFTSFGLKSA